MAKRAFLIHGWEGYPEEGWRPWLKDELKQRGFEVIVPAMPDTENPKLEDWLKHLIETVGDPNEECYFVGHSLGNITILRYLESLGEDKKIGGAVLVAGFTSDLGFEELHSFFTKPIDWDNINNHCTKFVAIHSDNDPFVSLHYADFFKEKLGAEIIVKHDMKHFSGGDGVDKLPVALESVLKLSQ